MKWTPLVFLVALIAVPLNVRAADLSPDATGDCVIRDFSSHFDLKSDSSLAITEDITADCGNLPGKHGIFRILPTRASRPKSDYAETPIHLDSITDFDGKSLQFQTIRKSMDHTLTWKIGDPDVTIKGEQHYRISYSVANAVESVDSGHVRLYWNLNGAFWQLPIEHFTGTVSLPSGLSQSASTVTLTSGNLGTGTSLLATSHWSDNAHLVVESTQPLAPGEAITVSLGFPAGILTLYQPTFWELYQNQLWFLLPLISLIVGFLLWRRFGHDPRMRGAIMVEYAPPTGLLPLQMGMVHKGGSMQKELISSTIIDFAVRGYLTITEQEKSKALGLMKSKEWLLTRTDKKAVDLRPYEQTILKAVFPVIDDAGASVELSTLRPTLSGIVSSVQSEARADLDAINVFDNKSGALAIALGVAATVAAVVLGWLAISFFDYLAVIAVVLAWVIAMVFALLMPRRTPEGADLEYKIRGFKMYLGKAEKYRMPYYEKENIFEKYLPFAIAFGLTGKWIAAMKSLYGERYNSMLPAWYVFGGGNGLSSFDSFASNLDSLSSQISAASTPVSSGGGGFSGGGGGGGGGGSW
jgi:uncharacterized membrane protein YgcG